MTTNADTKTAETDNTTPRPWFARGGRRELNTPMVMEVLDSKEEAIVSGFSLGDVDRANAALIVRAVNSYDALVAALEAAETALHDIAAALPDSSGIADPAIDAIRAALALARGQEGA